MTDPAAQGRRPDVGTAIDDHTVLGRVLLIIDACLIARAPVTLAELTTATGLAKPTVRRLARSLTDRGLLDQTRGRFGPGWRLAAAGTSAAALRGSGWPEAKPYLVELHRRTGAAVWLVDITNADRWPLVESIYGIAAVHSGYAEVWPHRPDDPAVLATALGRMAFADAPDRAENLFRGGLRRLTARTEISPRRVSSAIQSASRNREAVEYEGVVTGWSCLAVPLVDDNERTTAVLGVVARTPHFRTAAFLGAAHRTAGELQSL